MKSIPSVTLIAMTLLFTSAGNTRISATPATSGSASVTATSTSGPDPIPTCTPGSPGCR